MTITQCVECDEDIEIANRVRLGLHLICEHCGTELEIVSVDPLEVEVAQIGADSRLWEDDENTPAYGDLDDEMLDKGLDPLDDDLEDDVDLDDDLDDEENLDDADSDDDAFADEDADDELTGEIDDDLDEFDFDYDDEEFDFDDEDFELEDDEDDRW